MLAHISKDLKFKSIFKTDIAPSEEAVKILDKVKTWDFSALKTEEQFENLYKTIGVTNDSLKQFLQSEEYSEKTLANFTTFLKKQHGGLNGLATGFKNVAKSIGKMALNLGTDLLVGLAVGAATKGIDYLIHKEEIAYEKATAKADTSRGKAEEAKEEAESLNDLIKKYEELGKVENRDNETTEELRGIRTI